MLSKWPILVNISEGFPQFNSLALKCGSHAGFAFLFETLDCCGTTETIESASSKTTESNSKVYQYSNGFVTKRRSKMLYFKVRKDVDA